MSSLRIAMIGAGSVGFTRRLLRDILTVPELQEVEFRLMDISPRNLEMVSTLCQKDIQENGLNAKVVTTVDQKEAVEGAKYVFCTIRQGGLDAFKTDIDIPLLYGVDQCVGDTLCAGGLMYAQRTIPVLLNLCRDIREAAAPGALLMNYSNPMAMNTWACQKYGGVPTVGLCHGVQGAHWQITRCIERWAKAEGLLGEEETLHPKDVDVIASGINHQTWFVRVQWRGIDFLPRLLELFEAHPDYSKTEKVRIDVMRRFGYYSTESNGHLSEYLPWYRKRSCEIPQWIDLSSWINGETGGYLRVCTEGQNWFKTDYPNWLEQPSEPITPEKRSEEHGSYIIEAMETGRIYRGHINVRNGGSIPNLAEDAVVEIPCYVDKSGIRSSIVGDLPLACAATCSASINVQRMGMEAAVHADVMLLKQAMLHDPLIGAVCNPEEAWQMTDEMLVAQAQWLPQYSGAIANAATRLAHHEAAGTRVTRQLGNEGAVRLKLKSVEEMAANAEEARRNAQASDKGKMTANAE